MKLVVVFCIEEYEKELRKLFFENHLPVFSEMPVKGFKLPEAPGVEQADWFSHSRHPVYSTMSVAFVSDGQTEALFNAIEEFNQSKSKSNPVHAYQLAVENFV